MTIILSYGLAQKHECQDLWRPLLPKSLSVSEYWPGNLKTPGPYDLMAIAIILMKIRGVKIEGKLSDGTMPFWDLTLKDNVLTGRPLDKSQKITDEGMSVINALWAKRKTDIVQTVIVDKLNHWYCRMIKATAGNGARLSRAICDTLMTDTVYWLSKSCPVILQSYADWVDADRSTRIPSAPAELAAMADVTLFVHEGILVESVRKAPLFLLDIPEGKIEQRLLMKSLGILAETEVMENV